jgi:2-oxoglutarate ferredoxin oxidoreductase subunit delta
MTRPAGGRVLIEREWCKGCGICVALCPADVLALDEQEKATVAAPDRCTLCRACELHCPDLAIVVVTAARADEPAAGAAAAGES